MIQSIVSAIDAALRNAFPGVTVYTEQVKQGLKEPCFIVRAVDVKLEPLPGKRYYHKNSFTVHYYPQSTTDAKRECDTVAAALFGVLQFITVDDSLQRGVDLRGEYFDGILAFFVNYNLILRTIITTELMGDLTIEYHS